MLVVTPALRGLFLDLNAFLFPSSCVVCRSSLPSRWPIPLCSHCRRKLVPVRGPTCLLCRTRDRDRVGFMAGRTCRDPSHDGYRAWAAVQMIDPADTIVHALKFHDRPEVGPVMALFMARRLLAEGRADWDRVLPMPLHPARERARGYNQSAEISARLARSIGAVPVFRCLSRARATRPQADLDHEARRSNVEGAFRVAATRRRSDRTAGPIAGRRVLVVDDVATTGHTLVAALDALTAGGPEATGAAVFALA